MLAVFLEGKRQGRTTDRTYRTNGPIYWSSYWSYRSYKSHPLPEPMVRQTFNRSRLYRPSQRSALMALTLAYGSGAVRRSDTTQTRSAPASVTLRRLLSFIPPIQKIGILT